MLKLYTHPMSPCAQKVRIVLTEKKLPWEAQLVDLAQKENLQPDYLKLNPLGVVPTLVDQERPIIESSIICEYLDDRFPTPRLSPEDPYRRAQMRFWLKHIDVKLHPSCGALQWPLIMRPALLQKTAEEREKLLDAVPEKPRRERQKRLLKMGLEAPDVADAVATYRKTILEMEAALTENRWLIGPDFSLADTCLAPYFQTLQQFGWQRFYEDCPHVVDWFARCIERPSYQQGVAADFSPEILADLKAKGDNAWPVIEQHLATCIG